MKENEWKNPQMEMDKMTLILFTIVPTSAMPHIQMKKLNLQYDGL
jgi:hypothetical protein